MATKWNLDPAHSEIEFKVKHMMITNVKGNFQSFAVDVDGEELDNAKFTATIDAASINTSNADRDAHLKGADFFDAEKYPSLVFKSNGFKNVGGDDYELTGDLTIKDVTKPVTLQVEFGGKNTDPWGNEKAGYTLSGKISRKEWGLNWNAALETGGVLVSDDVRINGEIQLVKQV